MSDLKSLKDILEKGKYCSCKESLRNEAIVWIKEIEKEVNIDSNKIFKCTVNDDGDFEYWYEGKVDDQIQETSIALIAWIKLFFNLE